MTKTFIFKYDPTSSLDKMLTNFQKAWRGELKSVEPHVIKSNNIEALLTGLTKERLKLFSTLGKEEPDNLEQLADYLQRGYEEVKKDAEILASWGIIKLPKEGHEEKPVVLYDQIVLEWQNQVFLIAENIAESRGEFKQQILTKPKENIGKMYTYEQK